MTPAHSLSISTLPTLVHALFYRSSLSNCYLYIYWTLTMAGTWYTLSYLIFTTILLDGDHYLFWKEFEAQKG